MARIEAVNAVRHRDIRIDTRADASLGDARNFAQVVISEFVRVAAHYPIVLTKSAETGSFMAGMLLGIEDEENVFLDTPDGQERYRPLAIRREPFFIAGDDLAIDMDHPRVGRAKGELLFDGDGRAAPYLRAVQTMMTQLQHGIDETQRFVETLLRLSLVEPIDVSLRFDDGTRRRLDGLYTVSSDRLQMIDDNAALALFRSGELRLIHTMMGSLEQVSVLACMHNARL